MGKARQAALTLSSLQQRAHATSRIFRKNRHSVLDTESSEMNLRWDCHSKKKNRSPKPKAKL